MHQGMYATTLQELNPKFIQQKYIIPPTPLTDAEIRKTLSGIEEAIRYRLRMSEIIPVEMSQYRIGRLISLVLLRGLANRSAS